MNESVKHGLHIIYTALAAAIPVIVLSESFRSFVENHGVSAATFTLLAAALRAAFHAQTGK